MKIHCTRPGCPRPENVFTDLDQNTTLKTVQQKYCTTCGMPLILDGRYLPERLLGKGGFGAAFLAYDRRSPGLRNCVVKQFQPPSDFTPEQLELAQQLFEREAVVLDRLGNQHPQIPNLLAYFPLEVPRWQSSQNQQFFYIVQDYIDGQDLEAELASKGQFFEGEVQEVLEKILNVLQFVHDQNVIHRDIKPSNIMRDRNGRLYLLDFGAVKQVTQQANQGKSTGIYSMGYAPPEQMRGHHVFPSTDLYALAVTCIVLLTGKDPQQLYDSHNDCWNWKNSTQVSDSFANILDVMLQSTPSDRYASAEKVLKVLSPAQMLQPVPVSSTVQSPPPQGATQLQSTATTPTFSTIQLLTRSAFTGFEIALLGTVLNSVLNSLPLIALILGGTLGGLILAQYRRWIETTEQIIITIVSLALAFFLSGLGTGIPLLDIIIFPVLTALGFVAITALFRLVYLILYRFL